MALVMVAFGAILSEILAAARWEQDGSERERGQTCIVTARLRVRRQEYRHRLTAPTASVNPVTCFCFCRHVIGSGCRMTLGPSAVAGCSASLSLPLSSALTSPPPPPPPTDSARLERIGRADGWSGLRCQTRPGPRFRIIELWQL